MMTVMTMTMMVIAGGGIIVSVRRAEPTEVEACSPLTLLTIHQKYKDIIRYMKIKTITIHRRKISQKTITPIALLKKQGRYDAKLFPAYLHRNPLEATDLPPKEQ